MSEEMKNEESEMPKNDDAPMSEEAPKNEEPKEVSEADELAFYPKWMKRSDRLLKKNMNMAKKAGHEKALAAMGKEYEKRMSTDGDKPTPTAAHAPVE